MDQDPSKRPFRRIRVAGSVVVPLAIYGGPPAVFAACAHDPNWADFWETAATPYGTMTAGFAAIAAAGIAYANGKAQRETDRHTAQQELDHAKQQLAATTADADRKHNAEIVRELRTRYTTAVEQLANPATTISQAGASAIAALADDWLRLDLPTNIRINTTAEAQTCINILCTYLRTDHPNYNPDPLTPNSDRRQPDQPVRDTILNTITAHLRPNPPGESWQHLNYDFTEASFHNANFDNCTFLGDTTTFTVAKFHGTRTSFKNSQFHGDLLLFAGAEFHGGQANFTEAQFHSMQTNFAQTKFYNGESLFTQAQFHHLTSFAGAEFFSYQWTMFNEVQFTGSDLYFAGATFQGDWICFDGAQFRSTVTHFGATKFQSAETTFEKAGFHSEKTEFRAAKFLGMSASFENPTAWRNVKFLWDGRPNKKPDTVHPDEWPPQVVEPPALDDQSDPAPSCRSRCTR